MATAQTSSRTTWTTGGTSQHRAGGHALGPGRAAADDFRAEGLAHPRAAQPPHGPGRRERTAFKHVDDRAGGLLPFSREHSPGAYDPPSTMPAAPAAAVTDRDGRRREPQQGGGCGG